MTRHLCGMGFVWGLLAVTTIALGQAPVISDDTAGATTTLTDKQKAEVDKFWEFQADLMVNAKELKDVVAGRQAITAAYANSGGKGFRGYFAAAAAPKFAAKVLQSKRPATLVNAALALSVLREPEAVSALNLMIGHPNAAVRYWAMRGYLRVRAAMLSAGGAEADRLVKALSGRVQAETSPVVAGLLFEALDFSVGRNAPKTTLAASIDLIGKGVGARLQALRDGDVGSATGYLGAVKAIGQMAGYADKDQRIVLLKALGEILANAGMAYADRAEALGKSKGTDETLKALDDLLRRCEAVLARMVGTETLPVTDVLNSALRATIGPKLREAVTKWIGDAANPGALTHASVPSIRPLVPTPKKVPGKPTSPAPTPTPAPTPVPAPAPVTP